MSYNFANVIEEVQKLSSEDKGELKFLLERYLIEERRKGIYQNYNESLKELHENKLEFSSDINNKLKEISTE